jgi:hypothetical protein
MKVLTRSALSLFLCLAVPVLVFAASPANYKVKYRGGSFPNLKSGAILQLVIDSGTVSFLDEKHKELASIPAATITEVSYGRDVHRRVGTAIGLALITPFGIGALAAFSKSKKHYVGLIWNEGTKKGGMAMQCDKRDYRGVLAALEAVSGRKSVNPAALSVK